MKPETLLDAMSYIDEDLLARAEAPETKKIRRFPRRLMAVAACLTLILGATAFATGALDPLLAYFGGETETYLEEILSAGASVSNETMELRLEGAIADSRTAYLVVSLIGLTEDAKQDLILEGFGSRPEFELYALTLEGERVEFHTTSSGSYTDGSPRYQSISYFEDAQQTYSLSGTLPETLSMKEIEQVCFSFGGLTLDLDVQNYLCQEVSLKGDDIVPTLSVSSIGFNLISLQYQEPWEIYLITQDGSLDQEIGMEMAFRYPNGMTYVDGHWCDSSPIDLIVLDLDDYCGLQVNGVNYYFVEE